MIKRMPFFSIIIPVYNVAPYLRECLDSVLSQTFTNWEAVCVDDGSTDCSGEILNEYAVKDGRFRVVHQGNAGVSAARNTALEICDGEWLLFLDADDVFSPYALEVCARTIKFDPNIICIRFKRLEFDEQDVCHWSYHADKIESRRDEFGEKISQEVLNGPLWCRAYKFSEVKGIRFLPFCMGEDNVWIAEVLDKISTMVTVNQVCYGYRQRDGSAIHSKWTERKFLHELGWRMYRYGIWNKSVKCVDEKVIRRSLIAISEGLACVYFSMNRNDRKRVFDTWITVMSRISNFSFVPFYFRFVMKINYALRNDAITWITLYCPCLLKKLIHRFGINAIH